MHFCFLSPEYPKKGVPHGGIGSFLATFCPLLVQLGHRVSVVGIGPYENDTLEIEGGVKLYRVNFPKKSKFFKWYHNYRKLNQIVRKIHQEDPIDFIEGSESTFAFCEKIPGIKYVIRLHGGHHFFAEGENRKVNKWKGFQEKTSFAKSDAFIAVSEYVKEHTEKLLSYNNKPVEVINYPISTSKFYKGDDSKTIQGNLVFAGTVCEKKGVRQLIASLPEVLKRFPDIHLNLYGRDWQYLDGTSYIESLKKEFSPELLNSVTFHGAVLHEQLPEIYEKAEVCIFPSHMETQGLVAPEAMLMGKPVIFSKIGPGPETIDHGVNGWLCDPKDPKDIAKVIIQALADKEKSKAIGEEGYNKAMSKFEPSVIVQKNLLFYKSLLK